MLRSGWFARTTKCDYSFWVPKHAAKYYDVCENPWARYDVYITKHLPHQSAYAAVCGIADCYGEHEDIKNEEGELTRESLTKIA
jgi:hypothetical protein